MTISGYETFEELSSCEWYSLFRGRATRNGSPVFLKVPPSRSAKTSDRELFKREFDLLKSLTVPGIPRICEFILNKETCCLVFDDSQGRPLREFLNLGRMRIESFFKIALPLSRVLAELHRQGIICRGLCPQAILFEPPTGKVTLIDLSLASRDSGEAPIPLPLHSLHNLLPYVSPELTGRMNRVADYRTDFYSLGILFYEMLMGTPPFSSKDSLELIHGHIAKIPHSPAEVDPKIPEPLSQLVIRLLAKTAEERYQSALGIVNDLEHCQREWTASSSVAPFHLGQQDVSDRFLIPQKLYGRDAEVELLLEAFDRTCQGPPAMVLVGGYSGIGKTSLIQELYKPIACQRGYFIGGKFDQVVRNVPFGALIQAFRALVQQLLTESEDRLTWWRDRLSRALGANGGVLAEVIPEIELIIGKQPTAPAIGPTEALNRFQLVFQNFVGALARREHPLVIFLDDLQWADAATLSLFQPLLVSQDIEFLFLMGAYRDNEIDPSHPLAQTLKALELNGAELHRVFLGPLELSDLTLFIGDALHGENSEVEPLARLVMEKTEGNPFFVIQFLKTLKQEGFLQFDYEQARWTYQLDIIRHAAMTDNVIDLMTRKIQQLSQESQHTLTLAACIGNLFDLSTLATVSQQSSEAAGHDLQQVLENGLVLPVAPPYEDLSAQGVDSPGSNSSYVFMHDRVQQAAYSLIPPERKQLVHLTVGRLLLEQSNLGTGDEKIFDILHHLNLGSSLIRDDDERLVIAQLNLKAGQKAKSSTAFEAALQYLTAGLSLLNEAHWVSNYALMFALHIETAECEYLCGRFDEADRDFELLLKRARTRLDKAQVYGLRILEYENLSRYSAAVECGREGLALFGVSFPNTPEGKQAALETELSVIKALLGGRPIDALVALPVMENPEKKSVMKILTTVWASAYIGGDQVLTCLISATLVRFSLEYGNTEESAYGYATHTITVGPVKGDYKSAYEWGELALLVNERFNDRKGRAKIHQQFHAHANLWRRPFQTCVPHAREATRYGLETGDFAYAGYGAFTECWHTLLVCRNLEEFVGDCSSSLALLERLKMTGLIPAQKAIQNWARALQGHTAHPTSFSDEGFDEKAFIEAYGNHPFRIIYYYILKVHLCVLFEEFDQAHVTAGRARRMTHNLLGTIWPVYLDFFEGLALAAVCGERSKSEQGIIVGEVVRIRESLSLLADNCPENFRCAALLLSAELESIQGKTSEANETYEQAIQYARVTENLHNEALSCELYGRFWRRKANRDVASVYFEKARQRYSQWGAIAKVRHLEESLSNLMLGPISVMPSQVPVTAESTEAVDPQSGTPVSLDIVTVTKAARAIGMEIELEELLRKLMKIAIENAGAQRGLFLQELEGGLVIQAEGSVDQDFVSVLEAVPVENSRKLSLAIVHYVQKTGKSVVLGDALADDRFLGDPYVASTRPKSILCVPVVHQGKFSGILYLENNLAANAFTADRTEVMHILCSQAAISLENARLYNDMKQEAARRQQAEQMLRSLTEGTASVTGADFFRSLVRYLASALQARYAFVTECKHGERLRARMLAFWTGGSFGENLEYDVAPTPCGKVLEGLTCYYDNDLQILFPDDKDLVLLGAQSFLGVPIFNAAGSVIGHIAILDDKPMGKDPQGMPILRIFAARAGAEIERLHAEENLRAALVEVETLKNRLHAENIYLQEEIRREHNFEEIVGSSPSLLGLLRQVEQVAPTDSTILIYGESGTGKELIARAIHDRSLRRKRPLVKVNCGAISAGLVESELFGHVKGAFTGAIENRSGRFELADGGTLFLDEVSELPLETQVKLLRVLQEQEFEPVGSSRTLRVDVRIIAATNRNLEEAVHSGHFRSDLFYRLNVVPLTLPPLRERQTDVPQLVMFFLSRFSKKLGKKFDTVSKQTMDRLIQYQWPGNIRELQNLLERAVVLSQGSVLTLQPDLFPALGSSRASKATAAAVSPPKNAADPPVLPTTPQSPAPDPALTLMEVERQHILEVLIQTKWVIEGINGAARVLNLHPNTLRSRMKKLGIQRSAR